MLKGISASMADAGGEAALAAAADGLAATRDAARAEELNADAKTADEEDEDAAADYASGAGAAAEGGWGADEAVTSGDGTGEGAGGGGAGAAGGKPKNFKWVLLAATSYDALMVEEASRAAAREPIFTPSQRTAAFIRHLGSGPEASHIELIVRKHPDFARVLSGRKSKLADTARKSVATAAECVG